MRDVGTVHVDRAIVHVIDHVGEQKPITSDYEIPLSARPKLREYFEGQVAKAVRSATAYPARFDPAVSDGVPAACYRILEAPQTHFVDASKELASALFAASGGNKSISIGSLVCCLYSASNFPGNQFLALVKVDLTEVLIQEVETDSQGHTVVTFSVHDDALPTLGAELLKAALIRPRSKAAAEYELLLLDTQVKGEPAAFFAMTFLHAIPILDPRQETQKLHQGLRIAVRNLAKSPEPILDPQELDDLEQNLDSWFYQSEIDTRADLDRLKISSNAERNRKAKEVIQEKLDRRLVDRKIKIDSAVASRLVRKVRFKGDHGVAVEFDAHHAGEVYQLVQEWDAGADHYSVVQLTVRNLKWIAPLPGLQ